MKKTVLLTYDYELFLGRSGKLNETLIIPTNKLLGKLRELRINVTFFVDILYYYRLSENSLYDADKKLVKEQIQQMVRDGHDVQLHLHPHWISAKYREGEWHFELPFKYRLQQHSSEDIRFFFKTGISLLEEICKPIDTNYKVKAFRAGGLCIEPFDEIKKYMVEFDLKIDSSVAPGLKRNGRNLLYDFSNISPKEHYRFSDSPFEKEMRNGQFLEIPINTYYTSVFSKFKKLIFNILNPENDFGPKGVPIQDIENQEESQPRSFFRRFQKDIRILSLDYMEHLDVSSEIKNNNNGVFTILAHPKLQSNQSLFQLEKLYKQRHIFKTISEYYSTTLPKVDEESNKRSLFLVTGEYPFGNWENALETEIHLLAKSFKSIYVICSPSSIKLKRLVPDNVFVFQYHNSLHNIFFNFLRAITSQFLIQELKFIIINYPYKNFLSLTKIAIGTLKNAFNFSSFLNKLILREKLKGELSFYSYWASDRAIGLALLKDQHKNYINITRAHSWDVYFERHVYHYLPFRFLINTTLDRVAYISENSRTYTLDKLKLQVNPKASINYLGVKEFNRKNTNVREEWFNVFSCSAIIPLKRLSLIIDALNLIPSEVKIKWIHAGIGDVFDLEGNDLNSIQIKKYALEKLKGKNNIDYQFIGYVNNDKLEELYNLNNFNAFINVSSIEGVPISIMEAMSNKVPIIATNVGGVAECVVDNYNGRLLSANPTVQDVANAIQWIQSISNEEYTVLCSNSYSLWNIKFNSEKNYSEFISFINPQ